MRVFDAAAFLFLMSLTAVPVLTIALVKKNWRNRAWRGLKINLVVLAASFGASIATMPPKDVRDAEAASRTAQAEQAARVKAEKDTIEAEAKRQLEIAKAEEQRLAAEEKRKTERAAILEGQIDWSNKLWALSVLSASMIRSGDLDGLANARSKAGELFIEASGWTEGDAKLAFLCSQAADALKHAIIAARDGNMSGRPDSYSTQMKRWDSHHDQCSATARELRGEPPLNKAKKAKTAG